MAITRVKGTGKIRASGSATIAMSFGTLPAAGNLIIVTVWAFESPDPVGFGTGACTDNQGNTYTRAVVNERDGGAGAHWGSVVYYAFNIGTPSGTFTITVDATAPSPTYIGAAFEYSGMLTTDPVDKTTSGNGVGTTASTGTTATLAQAEELVIAVMSVGGGGTVTPLVGGSFTELITETDDDTYQGGESDELIVAATTAQSASWTYTGSRDWTAALATFKGAGGAAATAPPPWPPAYRLQPILGR